MAAPHCIRRFDTDLTVARRRGEVHFDGQIWSQALWEIRGDYQDLPKSTNTWDTTLIDAQFGFAPDTSFSAAAKATYLRALQRDGSSAAAKVRTRFAARGITFLTTAARSVGPQGCGRLPEVSSGPSKGSSHG